jgi:5-formyltetrahydrofolate cyclo-ligase
MTADDPRFSQDQADVAHLRAHAKRELRTRMRAVRRVLPRTAAAERAAKVGAQLLQLPEFNAARTLIGFSAIHNELDPSGLLAAAQRAGKRVGLPRVDGEQIRLHVYESGDVLEESGYEILEPLASAACIEPSEVDLLVVPGLAFDARGHRLGYGRGFYDRLLPLLSRAFLVGVAYDFQFVPELPDEPHDLPMHCIVSDARTLRI